MGLSAQNVAIVPTPSGVVDGHFPDGNDGTGAIPLTWGTVLPVMGKQVGTPFSIDLFATYLTQPGAPAATASLTPGFSFAVGSGWSLNSAGVLSYSGTGTGTGNIRVRATRLTATSDSNLFTYESIPAVSGDTIPPTIPTGLTLVSDTATTAICNTDVPSDVSTSTITASGFKEIRWFKGGVFDGSTSYGAGLLLRLTLANVANSGGSRKLKIGHYVALQETQTKSGIPNSTVVDPVGPISAGMVGLVCRYQWQVLETDAGGTYTLNKLRNELAQCSASPANGGFGVMLVAMVVVRTFATPTGVDYTGSAGGQNSLTIQSNDPLNHPTIATGDYGVVFISPQPNPTPDIVEIKNPVHVVKAGIVGGVQQYTATWTGNLTAHSFLAADTTWMPVTGNPLPNYIASKCSPFTSGTVGLGGGWQTWRWDTTKDGISQRYNLLIKAIGQADALDPKYPGVTFDQHPNFAGIATQETSNGSTTEGNYSQDSYTAGLKAEGDAIGTWLPTCRQFFYFNFMNGSRTTGQTNLLSVIDWISQYGAVVGGPDLVTSGSIVTTNCYPNYEVYHNGTAGNTQKSPGYTFCSVQNAEWRGDPPSDGNHTMDDLWRYGVNGLSFSQVPVGSGKYVDSQGKSIIVPNHLRLDIIVWDWHTSTLDQQSFNPALSTNTGVFLQRPPPFGDLPAPSGGSAMTPGSISQNIADYTVTSYGSGVGSTDDQWAAARGSFNGNGTVICKFNGMSGSNLISTPVMGVCVRDGDGPQARGAYMVATSTQLRSRYRISAGGPITSVVDTNSQGWGVPKWIKITRDASINLFSFYYSLDGNTWIAVGTATVAWGSTAFVHLFAGTTSATPVTASFLQVNVQQLAKINYTFTGLTTATHYNFTAVARDIAGNDSDVSVALGVTTP